MEFKFSLIVEASTLLPPEIAVEEILLFKLATDGTHAGRNDVDVFNILLVGLPNT